LVAASVVLRPLPIRLLLHVSPRSKRELVDESDEPCDEPDAVGAATPAIDRTRTDSTSTPSRVSARTSSSLRLVMACAARGSDASITVLSDDPRSAT